MGKYLLVMLVFSIALYSCSIDCKKATDAYRIYDLEVALTEKPTIYGDMKFVGRRVNSDKITTTNIMGRWFRNFESFMDVGDTIIKRQGELTMYIHKRDTVLIFKHECEGKVYE